MRKKTIIITAAILLSTTGPALALAQDAPRIRTALGLHPQIAHERAHELALLEQLLGGLRRGRAGSQSGPAQMEKTTVDKTRTAEAPQYEPDWALRIGGESR